MVFLPVVRIRTAMAAAPIAGPLLVATVVVAGGGCDARASLPLRRLRPEKVPPRVAPRASDGGWHSATRLLSRDECLVYAQTMRLTHIGSTTDEAEFPGCVVWQEKHVEFNERGSAAAGCESFERNHGRCVCAEV